MMGKNDRYNFDAADEDLDADDADGDVDDEAERELEVTPTDAETDADTTTSDMSETQPDSTTTESEDSTGEIPHRVRYDSPKDGRQQKMFYLADRDLDRLSELERLAETEFDENIHTSDVRLAALRSDLSDASFLLEMRRIGYGFFDE
jgi:hypothetical protein